ncbi:hypothetical protein [Sulfurimonas sp. NWX367]|uniref:hypothetical protein n=1 Tax=Sulfurimonas sp. NWX367 TaxID=2925413 RepID=UPI003204F358
MIIVTVDYVFYGANSPYAIDSGLMVSSNSVVVIGMDTADGSVSLLGSQILSSDLADTNFSISVDDFNGSGNTLVVAFDGSSLSVSTSGSSNSSVSIGENLALLLSGFRDFDSLVSNNTSGGK